MGTKTYKYTTGNCIEIGFYQFEDGNDDGIAAGWFVDINDFGNEGLSGNHTAINTQLEGVDFLMSCDRFFEAFEEHCSGTLNAFESAMTLLQSVDSTLAADARRNYRKRAIHLAMRGFDSERTWEWCELVASAAPAEVSNKSGRL